MSAPGPRWLVPAALACLTLATYGNGLGNGFVWDDDHVIVGNPDTRDPSALGRVLLSPDERSPYYRPLNRASYLLDYQLFGMDARGFHAVNLALHLASVLLLYALGRRLWTSPWPALVAAALLAVHPLGAEPVYFVTARNNLFALLFMLAAAVLLVDAERRRSFGRAALSGVALFLGLMSKEQAAGALPLLVAWLFVPGLAAPGARRRKLALLVPHALGAAVYAALRTVSLGGPVGAEGGGASLWARVAQNYATVPRYLALALWPRDLTIFHLAAERVGHPAWMALTWLAVLAAVALLLARPSPASTFGLLWLAFNYLPLANLVPIPGAAMAERFCYVPAVGLWIVLADAGYRLAERMRRPRLVAAAAAVAVALLATRTAARGRHWRDDLTLARSAVAAEPRAADAWFNLGVVLKDRGDLAGAGAAWTGALQADPAHARSLTQLGTLAAVRGDLGQAERLYRRALAADPATPLAEFNLARICERTGRTGEALERYRRFLALAPADREDAGFVADAQERLRALRATVRP